MPPNPKRKILEYVQRQQQIIIIINLQNVFSFNKCGVITEYF